jgi:hypothetical protein
VGTGPKNGLTVRPLRCRAKWARKRGARVVEVGNQALMVIPGKRVSAGATLGWPARFTRALGGENFAMFRDQLPYKSSSRTFTAHPLGRGAQSFHLLARTIPRIVRGVTRSPYF